MSRPAPVRFTDLDACVEATLSKVGKHVVLGLPVAIGKPNPLVNAFVRRAAGDPVLHLTIITALSLRAPRGKSGLERRFVEPFARRVFGDYPELEYVRMLEQGRLPSNIEVIEFYLEPGAWLVNKHLQQHYLSANYTHVMRDAIARGLNVVAQIVAPPPAGEMSPGVLSLGGNSDLTADLLPQAAVLRTAGRSLVLIGQLNRELPFMYGDALVPEASFDFLVDNAAQEFALFAPPNLPIPFTEHAIALNVSTLVKDGGTLQLGIGELGDAIVSAIELRHRHTTFYEETLAASGILDRHRALIETEGGIGPFDRGLYGCSEMLVDGFLDLYRAGILRRRVYPNARLQRLLDAGEIGEAVGRSTLDALAAAGLDRLSQAEFAELRKAGVFRDEVLCTRGMLVAPDGTRFPASLEAADERAAIAESCLGERLRNGVVADASFFLGPRAFYQGLRELRADERQLFAMRGIGFVNELLGEAWELKLAQRRHARFINTTMMVTGLGAAVSDGLADGRVVSGVGGQYNFVAMAHALPEARSILCLRSTRAARGKVTSNIVWNYAHATIPRHLRDMVVTEYGIADLRGRTDREIVEALVGVMDAGFQDGFVADAQRAGKLPRGYRVPDAARANRSEALRTLLAPLREHGAFQELPFGSDLTAEEVVLARALKSLAVDLQTWRGRLALVRRTLAPGPPEPNLRPYLERMALLQPASLRERIERRLLSTALRMSI